MKQFSLSKVSKLGEHDPKYGTTYWCEVQEDLTPVKFNSMNQNIDAGMTIACEEWSNKESAKGTEYLQLKKVKIVGQETAIQETPNFTPEMKQDAQNYAKAMKAPSESQISQILELVKENNELLKKLTYIPKDMPEGFLEVDEDG